MSQSLIIFESLLVVILAYIGIAAILSVRGASKGFCSIGYLSSNTVAIIVICSILAIVGNLLAIPHEFGIVNLRPVGVILGGLLGGPFAGLAVAIAGGIHRYVSIGGELALAAAIATVVDGLLAGLLYCWTQKKNIRYKLLSPGFIFVCCVFILIMHAATVMLISWYAGKPLYQLLAYIETVAMPMIAANAIGVAFILYAFNFHTITRNRHLDDVIEISDEISQKIDHTYDIEKIRSLLEFIRDKFHLNGLGIELNSGTPVRVFVHSGNPESVKSVSGAGVSSISNGQENYGRLLFLENQSQLFNAFSKRQADSIATLICHRLTNLNQETQKKLLLEAEIKTLRAQVNPHFLFNALNTLNAVTRQSPELARKLILNLSDFFRKNLSNPSDMSTLGEEIEHVNSYLGIEKIRFGDRLDVEFNIAMSLHFLPLPVFSLQPLVENAIKHGISKCQGQGKITISAWVEDGAAVICVEDNAGQYPTNNVKPQEPNKNRKGLGLDIVDRRIKHLYGRWYGLTITCNPGNHTRATLKLPYSQQQDSRKTA